MKSTKIQNELHTLYLQGLDFFSKGDIDSTKTIGQQLTIQNKDYAPGWYLLGQTHFAKQEYPQAFDCFANALNLDRNNSDYLLIISECLLLLGDFARSAGFADQVLQINPECKQAMLLIGQAHLQAKNLREAYQAFSQYTELDNENAMIWNNLGCIALMLDEIDTANQHFEKAIKINPNIADAYNNLGVIADHTNDLKKAIKMYKKSIEINEQQLDAYTNLAIAYSKQNQILDAIEYLDKALKISPDNLNVNIQLGKIFFDQQEYSKAILYLNKVHKINPHIHDVMLQLAISFYTLREYIQAKNFLLSMLQHNRNDSQALYYIGLVCQELFSYSDANKFFIDANSVSPDNIKILNSLAESYIILNKFDKAEAIVKDCLKISNENPYTDLLATLISIEKCDFDNTIKNATKLIIDSEKYWDNLEAKVINPYYIKAIHLSPELQDQYLKHYEKNLKRYTKMIAEFTYHNLVQTKHLQTHLGYLVPIALDYPLFDNIMTMIQEHNTNEIQVFVYRLDQLIKYSDREIATKINDDQIDVLIDLCGYDSLFSRPGILALKPALFQRSWLTSDYATNSSFIEPLKNVNLRVPFCHVIKKHNSKKDFELPEDKFIYCGFCGAEYLNPEILECWFTILEKTTDSVLWLTKLTSDAQNNIRLMAANRNIDTNRIIFSGIEKLFSGGPHNLANVILDTMPSKNNSKIFIAIQDEIPIVTFIKFPDEKLNALYADNRANYCKKAIALAQVADKPTIPVLKEQSDYFTAAEICKEIEAEIKKILKKSF